MSKLNQKLNLISGASFKAGDRFRMLTVAGAPFFIRHNLTRAIGVVCQCDCGAYTVVSAAHLSSGHTRSCGCWKRRVCEAKSENTKSGTPIYELWRRIRARCKNRSPSIWRRYGGRGISVCSEWEDFSVFKEWCDSNGYEQGLQIDRINNDGNYEPGNCRFVTAKQNCRNTSRSRLISAFGESKSVSEWCEDERCKAPYGAVMARLHRGWDGEMAISTPVKKNVGDVVLSVDPGTRQSGWVLFDGVRVLRRGIDENSQVRNLISRNTLDASHLVVEMIESFGMPVGNETHETTYWVGRFCEAWNSDSTLCRLYRREVKLHMCQSMKATDSNIRQAIIDRFPPTGGGAVGQIGTASKPGPLYGVSSHMWSALGLAVTWWESKKK